MRKQLEQEDTCKSYNARALKALVCVVKDHYPPLPTLLMIKKKIVNGSFTLQSTQFSLNNIILGTFFAKKGYNFINLHTTSVHICAFHFSHSCNNIEVLLVNSLLDLDGHLERVCLQKTFCIPLSEIQ